MLLMRLYQCKLYIQIIEEEKFNLKNKLIIKTLTLILSFTLLNPLTAISYAKEHKSQSISKSFPQITAESALTMDLDTGEIIYCKDADIKKYPASTTKLLTGLLLAENKLKTDALTYTESAQAQPEYSLNINYMHNTMHIGDKMSADDVMKGLLLFSGNDAAYMIADNISGDSKAFAELMNKRAKMLGANNSNFVTANGLHNENHYTTAYDLSLITKAAFANPWVRETMELPNASININNSKIVLQNRNLGLGKNGNIAGKTGTTNPAGGCLAAIYERNGRKLIGIILKDRQANAFDMTRFNDMDSIMDYSYGVSKKLYKSADDTIGTVEIQYGLGSIKTISLPIKLTRDVYYYENAINAAESQLIYEGPKVLSLFDLISNRNVKLTYKTRNHIEEVNGTIDVSKLIGMQRKN